MHRAAFCASSMKGSERNAVRRRQEWEEAAAAAEAQFANHAAAQLSATWVCASTHRFHFTLLEGAAAPQPAQQLLHSARRRQPSGGLAAGGACQAAASLRERMLPGVPSPSALAQGLLAAVAVHPQARRPSHPQAKAGALLSAQYKRRACISMSTREGPQLPSTALALGVDATSLQSTGWGPAEETVWTNG